MKNIIFLVLTISATLGDAKHAEREKRASFFAGNQNINGHVRGGFVTSGGTVFAGNAPNVPINMEEKPVDQTFVDTTDAPETTTTDWSSIPKVNDEMRTTTTWSSPAIIYDEQPEAVADLVRLISPTGVRYHIQVIPDEYSRLYAEESRRRAEEIRNRAEESRRRGDEIRSRAEESRNRAEGIRSRAKGIRRRAAEIRRRAAEIRRRAKEMSSMYLYE